MKNALNKNGIFLLDIFHLNYYGINVFFQVCKTQENSVCVYELALKTKAISGEKMDMLSKNLTASKNPLVVPKDINTYTKSNYRVYPTLFEGKLAIPIEIKLFSLLYNKAVELGTDYPLFGTAYAFLERDCARKCWERSNKDDSEELNCYID